MPLLGASPITAAAPVAPSSKTVKTVNPVRRSAQGHEDTPRRRKIGSTGPATSACQSGRSVEFSELVAAALNPRLEKQQLLGQQLLKRRLLPAFKIELRHRQVGTSSDELARAQSFLRASAAETGPAV